MADHRMEKRQARVVQEVTGAGYQKSLLWVRANHEELRVRTYALIQEHGLAEASRRATAELAREKGPSPEANRATKPVLPSIRGEED